MSRSAAQQFHALAVEAIRDAARRRVVAAVAVLSVLALWLVQRCSGVWTVTEGGQPVDPSNLLGWTSTLVFGALALWTVTLAGLLASDPLIQALEDGSASLALARPVSRETFALARLAGTLAVALGAGAILLVPTALTFYGRGLGGAPALLAASACILGAAVVSAAGMAASLWLPRLASFLVVLVGVGAIAGVNLASMFGAELSATAAAIDRFGPPLGSAVFGALRPWYGQSPDAGAWLAQALRLLLWSAGSIGLLVVAFRREEI